MNKKNGFSLIELLIVIAIIGIIAAIAYPSYQSHVIKTRRADAQAALLQMSQAMERAYTEASPNTYPTALGTGTSKLNFPSEAPLDGDTKYYNLKIATASGSSYALTAKPKKVQEKDGTLRYESTGRKCRFPTKKDTDDDCSKPGAVSWDAR
ncbi:type IV pilin protein [Zooshikella harenae]|uniref:Prepilin-type N-terminal cleavage/methylation domain-containing protein n=1 Tax=Zooshikella harenae TaxID=2827238 RepID=A0ABS5ZD08_9GAMM|nr:type IV pilin protein [Zooshikella harenae]MBU2711865.1 prepilin-type N-terminal cleavage/methylation domain-containing protein [Zooshikella harenae]